MLKSPGIVVKMCCEEQSLQNTHSSIKTIKAENKVEFRMQKFVGSDSGIEFENKSFYFAR